MSLIVYFLIQDSVKFLELHVVVISLYSLLIQNSPQALTFFHDVEFLKSKCQLSYVISHILDFIVSSWLQSS